LARKLRVAASRQKLIALRGELDKLLTSHGISPTTYFIDSLMHHPEEDTLRQMYTDEASKSFEVRRKRELGRRPRPVNPERAMELAGLLKNGMKEHIRNLVNMGIPPAMAEQLTDDLAGV
jgi:hypothetical protein